MAEEEFDLQNSAFFHIGNQIDRSKERKELLWKFRCYLEFHLFHYYDPVYTYTQLHRLKRYGPAVYILLTDAESVYVGETWDLYKRIRRRMYDTPRIVCFGAHSVWPLTRKKRRELETWYIGDVQAEGFIIDNVKQVKEGIALANERKRYHEQFMQQVYETIRKYREEERREREAAEAAAALAGATDEEEW